MTRDQYIAHYEMRNDNDPNHTLRHLERRRKELEELAARAEEAAERHYQLGRDGVGRTLEEDAERCRREIDHIDDQMSECRAEISRITGRQFGRKAEEQDWKNEAERSQR